MNKNKKINKSPLHQTADIPDLGRITIRPFYTVVNVIDLALDFRFSQGALQGCYENEPEQ